MCVRALTVQRLRVGQVLLELLVQVLTDSDVLEHSLQFGRVLKAARLLQEEEKKSKQPCRRPTPTHTHTRCLECVTSAHACDSDLEFGDHAGLGVVAGAVLVDQTFGQHLGVKLLENVFVLDVLEHNHLREETAWSLWFHCKTKTSPYREARVTASHHLVQSVLQFSLLWVFGAEKETKTNKMLFSISFGG